MAIINVLKTVALNSFVLLLFGLALLHASSECFSSEYLPGDSHPRIWLTNERLTELRSRASANAPEWLALSNWCDSHLNETGYEIGSASWKGYRYSGYQKYILNYALAYQILKHSNPVKAENYATYAIAIMNGMVNGASRGEEINGIGVIRVGEALDGTLNQGESAALGINYSSYKLGYSARTAGVALPLAYDWLHEKLSVSERVKFASVMYRWIDWYRGKRTAYNNGVLVNGIRYFEDLDGDCTGNNNCTSRVTSVSQPAAYGYGYFSVGNNFNTGFVEMAALVPLATYGDSPDAKTYFDLFRTEIWENTIKPHLISPISLKGGDSPEGWNYGSSWQRVLESIYAYRTATGEDLFTGLEWPKEYMKSYIHATASNRKDMIRHGEWTGSYVGVPYEFFLISPIYILRKMYLSDDTHKIGQSYWKTSTLAAKSSEWERFLWIDPMAEVKDMDSEPLYYHAIGTGLVTMRSTWANTSDAVFASVQLGGMMKHDHENYDEGNILIQRGNDSLLVHQNMQVASVAHNTIVFNSDSHHASNPTLSSPAIDRIENNDFFLYVRADISNAWKRPYKADKNKLFCRSILYLRPGKFIVYDQTRSNTTVGNLKDFYTQYAEEPTVDTVSKSISAIVGASKIVINTLYPNSGTLTKTNPAVGYWRVKFTPATLQEYDLFLHVIEAISSNGSQTSTELYKTLEGRMIGALIMDAGKPTIALFNSNLNGGDVAVSTGEIISYSIPASMNASLQHILVHLSPNTDFTILASTTSDDKVTFRLKAGAYPDEGTVKRVSGQGVLTFGAVSSGPTPPAPPRNVIKK